MLAIVNENACSSKLSAEEIAEIQRKYAADIPSPPTRSPRPIKWLGR
jgi:hypothetical protein